MIQARKILFPILLILIYIVCGSCIASRKLLNNRTKVPKKNNIFRHENFPTSIFQKIDTNSLYVEVSTTDPNTPRFISAYRFYSNGGVNYFTFREGDTSLNNFNPSFNGFRGYLFKDGETIKIMICVPINGLGCLGRLYKTIHIDGNNLTVVDDKYSYVLYFRKRSLAKELKPFKACWMR